MDIDSEHLGIPDTDYAATIQMPASEYQRICRDLSSIGDTGGLAQGKASATQAASDVHNMCWCACRHTSSRLLASPAWPPHVQARHDVGDAVPWPLGSALWLPVTRSLLPLPPYVPQLAVQISATKDGVKFSTSGDVGTANITVRQNNTADKVSKLSSASSSCSPLDGARHACMCRLPTLRVLLLGPSPDQFTPATALSLSPATCRTS